ncbi:T6SS immunity protein Tli4 family protein [Paraburkholderia sediminicola]|uniref:T6SS immunity protein Tli4 family protein n=1 Tax=Paraburkholderia sediminicola TaxID=458836 RepID=UPI0038B72A96
MNRSGLAITIVAASFLMPLTGCSKRQDYTMSAPSTTANVTPLKTVCVGRYTIGIPHSATNVRLLQSFKGIDIDVMHPTNQQRLHDEMIRKIASDAEVTDFQPKQIASQGDNVTDPVQVWQSGNNLYSVHGITLKQDTGFLFSIEVTNDSVQGAKVAISQLIQAIQLRDPFSVPAEQGFCIERGFIPGGYAGGETASISLELPESDASLLMSTNTEAKNTGGNLLSRMSNLPVPLANLVSSDTEILRRGGKIVAGREGDEYGYAVKQSKDVSLEWSALTGNDHATDPTMKISMDTRSAVPEAARAPLMVLWDEILSSVKRR